MAVVLQNSDFINPELIFAQKLSCWAYFRGSLFLEGLIFGRAYYGKDNYVCDFFFFFLGGGGVFLGMLIFGRAYRHLPVFYLQTGYSVRPV